MNAPPNNSFNCSANFIEDFSVSAVRRTRLIWAYDALVRPGDPYRRNWSDARSSEFKLYLAWPQRNSNLKVEL
jgi:hypothetical protein